MEILLMVVALLGVMGLGTSMRILKEYERAVIFRLGRVRPLRGPGLIFMVPFGVERMERVSLRIIAMDVPAQDVITRDNVSVKVNAVLYFRVSEPMKAILEIQDYLFATSQLAQTTLRSVIGQADLDEVLAEREKFNRILRDIIDEGTDAWGIDVTGVEVKDVDLPQEMKRVIARQAEAERERRAKVISAHGELQAAGQLERAAEMLSRQPASLQLRFLQTASEIAAENNSTTIFPIPLDLFTPLQRLFGTETEEGASEAAPAQARSPEQLELGAAADDLREAVAAQAEPRPPPELERAAEETASLAPELGPASTGEESSPASPEPSRREPEPEPGEQREERPIEDRIDKEEIAEEARRRIQGDE